MGPLKFCLVQPIDHQRSSNNLHKFHLLDTILLPLVECFEASVPVQQDSLTEKTKLLSCSCSIVSFKLLV